VYANICFCERRRVHIKASSAVLKYTFYVGRQIDWRRALLLSRECVRCAASGTELYALVELLSVSSRCSRGKMCTYAGGRFWRVPHSGEKLSPGGKVRSLNWIGQLSVNFAIKIAWGLRGEVSYRANVNFLSRHLQRLYWKWWKWRSCQCVKGFYIELLWCHGVLRKWFMWNVKLQLYESFSGYQFLLVLKINLSSFSRLIYMDHFNDTGLVTQTDSFIWK
jgi:hypothetical protein